VARTVHISPQALQEAKRTPFNAPVWTVAGAGANLVRDVARHGVVLSATTDARYREHQAANDAYLKLRQQYAGNFEGNTFVARNAQTWRRTGRLQSASNKVEDGQANEIRPSLELSGTLRQRGGSGKDL
jgi:hypothetical protein